ncbi:MAG: hypothetical protein HKN07_13260 [Acidimicrobiia bacterium]|nr:hypothetical protein [Acidimicrobiia bacterium]NNF65210.1 hypothetical protein [Acidimicrobiia bacterium]
MTDTTMRASKPMGKFRSPNVYGVGRVCANSHCDTKLSRYNCATYCYTHAPKKFPRVRGKK